MNHGISVEQWLAFLDGAIEPERGDGIRAHMNECSECAKLAAELETWGRALAEEGRRVREAARLPDEAIESLLAGSLERIRSGRPPMTRLKPHWTVREAITILHFLMEPLCGAGTARATIDLAVRRSADNRSRVTPQNWRLFVGNLSDAAALICGLAFARLVDRVGLCLAIEEG